MTFSLSKSADSIDDYLNKFAPHEPEFQQAVRNVVEDIKPVIDNNHDYKSACVFERLVEPERIISFQVAWQNDAGEVEVNRGHRVQFNGAIGPYKGGIRFHPTVNRSVLKFLGFEQTFKNALTGLPMGGGKGGSDFNPKGRSDNEIMRFCNAFMQELYRHIHPDTDVPAGDINVGSREIGYLFGAYRRITNQFQGALTGKGLSFGGSELRTEATGYGAVYFLREMLERIEDGIDGKRIIISGAGNVATHAAEKAIEFGAKVISLSDSTGFVHDEAGLTPEKIEWVRRHKSKHGTSLEAYVDEFGGKWKADASPWAVEADIAIPCAIQNELNEKAARHLQKNGVEMVVEGANMPTTSKAKAVLKNGGIQFAPGKAANAGGVVVSGLEISQNRYRQSRSPDSIDESLQTIMANIHQLCVTDGMKDGKVNYDKGANVAAFRKIADAIVAQGVG